MPKRDEGVHLQFHLVYNPAFHIQLQSITLILVPAMIGVPWHIFSSFVMYGCNVSFLAI